MSRNPRMSGYGSYCNSSESLIQNGSYSSTMNNCRPAVGALSKSDYIEACIVRFVPKDSLNVVPEASAQNTIVEDEDSIVIWGK